MTKQLNIPYINLNDGTKIPAIGLGTWQAEPGEVEAAVKLAIDLGYRHFDCAMLYGNEKEIGTAIREKIAEGAIKREELYIVTKLWNTFHRYDQVVPTCKQSLKNFGLDYVDLYLVHWPVAQKLVGELERHAPFNNCVPDDETDYLDTWKGMEDCVKLGLTKSIGISNFNRAQTKRLLENCKIKPVMNQVEMHPNLTQKKLLKFCHENGIQVTAYSPFGSPARPWAKPEDPVFSLSDEKLIAMGKKYGKTSAQVVLRYIAQNGAIPIPKSTNATRLKQNLEIFDFELSAEDMKTLDAFNCNGRAIAAEDFRKLRFFPFDGSDD